MITQTMPRCFCELAFDTVIVQKPVGDGLFYIFFQKYYFLSLFNPFLTNVPLMQKPGSWFLLAKCLKNTCGRGDQIDDLHFYLKTARFVLVYFSSLNESTCQTRTNVFYFTTKALFVLEKIKFQNSRFSNFMTLNA